MAQFVREFLSLNPTGWTRKELKTVMRAQPRFLAAVRTELFELNRDAI